MSNAITFSKKAMNNLKMTMFEAIPTCNEGCPLYSECNYINENETCILQKRYISTIIDTLDKTVRKRDDVAALKMGFMILPVFQQLISFKMTAYSLGNNVMFGNKIHPVYKEIRETIKLANYLLDSVTVLCSDDREMGFLDGDSSYYDALLKNGEVPA